MAAEGPTDTTDQRRPTDDPHATVARSGDDLQRVEDPHLLRGEATFVADLGAEAFGGQRPVVAHAVTSPFGHAEIRSIDVDAAMSTPGVLAVLTAADIESAGLRNRMPGHPRAYPDGTARPVLADDRVRFVGEAVAIVVAEDHASAADGAEMVEVDYESLDAITDPLAAADGAGPLLFPEHGSNVVTTDALETERTFDPADHDVVVEGLFHNQRVAPAPMETRVAAAFWDGDRLVHYASCQGVHPIRDALAAWYRLDKEQVRVITSDVGGSFGAKARTYPEDLLLGLCAKVVGRPVRWTPPRSADMVGLGHSRAQHQTVRIGGRADGTIEAIDVHVLVDCGAYPVAAPFLARNTGTMLPGPYAIDQVNWRTTGVVTNTTPIVAYRGAGRPESGALLDRAIDLFAAEVGLDPADVRHRNLLTADQLPYTNPTNVTYDSGDYPDAFGRLLDHIGVDRVRADQAALRAAGATRHLGLGYSVFIDRTAGVPSSEYGAVRLRADGSFSVLTGSSPYGQGHYTTWIQLVSERTGVPVSAIEVTHGDTDIVPRGGITGGSRSAQKAGSAIAIATDDAVAVARTHAAALLEAAVGDVVLDTTAGRFHVVGSPAAASVGWSEVAAEAIRSASESGSVDPDAEIAYACEHDFEGDGPTVPYGAYGAVVEVDTETGQVEVMRIVSVDDAGTVINPTIVLGQVHGGIGQAVGQALWEEFVYDELGNPQTATFLDYGVPSAAEMPSFEAHLTEHPSPNNPLGAKGIAESGTIGAVPAIQNAVVDAVSHLGIRHLDLPVTPQRVWEAVREADDNSVSGA